MSFSITLYSFRKRKNSTLTPTVSGRNYSVVLKSPCTMLSPVFELEMGASNPHTYNYLFCGAFGRYYFIDDWEWDGRFWLAHCSSDPMGSFAQQIKTNGAYVLRAASDFDPEIYDTTYPAKAKMHSQAKIIQTYWSKNLFGGGGTFVVGIVGNNGGAVKYYAMSSGTYGSFCNFLYSNFPKVPDGYTTTGNDISWGDMAIVEYRQATISNIINFSTYITSVMWFPFPLDGSVLGSWETVKVAYWSSGVSAQPLTASTQNNDYYIDIPKHPDRNSRGLWLNASPYSAYTLYTQCFGAIALDPTPMISSPQLHMEVDIDLVSGGAAMRLDVRDADNNLIHIGQYSGQCGVSWQMAGTRANRFGGLEGMFDMLGALGDAKNGNYLSAAEGIHSGIQSFCSQLLPKAKVSGNMGAGPVFSGYIALVHEYYNPVDEDRPRKGRPLCKSKTLNSLHGFVMVADGNILTTATPAEKEQIKRYLEEGAYIE